MTRSNSNRNEDGQGDEAPTGLADAMRGDRPCARPEDDTFGFLPTARVIARTIRQAPAANGLVLHIDGEWGSGKSSMLGLVEHVLTSEQEDGDAPILRLRFNPWWFADHEHLAQQFLNMFAEALYDESKTLVAIGKLIAKYKDSLSTLVASSATLLGVPLRREWVKSLANTWFGHLVREQKDVAGLKSDIIHRLKGTKQRFVVFIDDVDRLTPAEIDQVFRVVKAVADFPNVIYLMAFDRGEVAKALSAELEVDGSAYLEKIVQVPFVLPTLRPDRLRDLLIVQVRQSEPTVHFGPGPDPYDSNVLAEMGQLVRRPRDLVRFANAFAPAYAGLRGDVAAVDVAALELLRVVEPLVYGAVRADELRFRGDVAETQRQPKDLGPLDADWSKGLSEARRANVSRLLDRIFPRRTPRTYSSQEIRRWETMGRVCSERGYAMYFRQQRPDHELMPRDVAQILAITEFSALLTTWRKLASVELAGGGSQAIDLLAQLRDFSDVPVPFARALLQVLLADGDKVVQQGRIGEPIEWLIYTAVGLSVPALGDEAGNILVDQVRCAKSLYTAVMVAAYVMVSADRTSSNYKEQFSGISTSTIDDLRRAALGLIDHAVQTRTLLHVPKLPGVLMAWTDWQPEGPPRWVASQIDVRRDLLALLSAYISWATSQDLGDAFATLIPRFDVERFRSVLPPEIDILQIEARVLAEASAPPELSAQDQETISIFQAALRSAGVVSMTPGGDVQRTTSYVTYSK